MDTLSFIATIVFVTASGALAPGPLFFAAISHGTRSGARGGLAFSIGHTFIELPLVILLALGLLAIASEPVVKLSTGVVGGVVLLVFGTMQIRDSLKSRFNASSPGRMVPRNPVVLGLVFTGLNPYFIVWWLTVGGELIRRSLAFASLLGVMFMFLCHVWMDYAWLTAVAHFAKMGTNVIGFKWYRLIMAVFGAVLVYFGFTFLISPLGF